MTCIVRPPYRDPTLMAHARPPSLPSRHPTRTTTTDILCTRLPYLTTFTHHTRTIHVPSDDTTKVQHHAMASHFFLGRGLPPSFDEAPHRTPSFLTVFSEPIRSAIAIRLRRIVVVTITTHLHVGRVRLHVL